MMNKEMRKTSENTCVASNDHPHIPGSIEDVIENDNTGSKPGNARDRALHKGFGEGNSSSSRMEPRMRVS